VLLELLLAGGCDIERSADPSVSGSFGWNQSRFKGPSSSSSWVLRVLCVCGSYNESGGTFHLDGWQRNLVCLVFSSRHFNMWRKKLTGDVFPFIGRNFRVGLFSSALTATHSYTLGCLGKTFIRREYIPMLFTTFPRIPAIFNDRAEQRNRDGKKCENESAPSTYFPREIFNPFI
jgi:hypothetical protein